MKTVCVQDFKHITIAGKGLAERDKKRKMLERSVNRQQNPLSSSKH